MSATDYFILYVADQQRSAVFYEAALGIPPRLNVPGMSEFILPGGAVLGLMPEVGIERLLGTAIAKPSLANGIARSELYLLVAEPAKLHAGALAAGARELSPPQIRDWGHTVSYAQDLDGHILAFACIGSGGASAA